jgi:hypothetical protein
MWIEYRGIRGRRRGEGYLKIWSDKTKYMK